VNSVFKTRAFRPSLIGTESLVPGGSNCFMEEGTPTKFQIVAERRGEIRAEQPQDLE
jgi:hypothetical protein